MTTTPPGFDQSDIERLAEQLLDGRSPAEALELVSSLMNSRVTAVFDELKERQRPQIAPVPPTVRGLQVRLDLIGTKPPIWRRLVLPGDLTLSRVHDVIQEAMGWTNSHLHRFSTGSGYDAPYFVTRFDMDEEGEDGILEDDVRLDQILSGKGDALWYEYDFGDGWRHKLSVEAVLDEAPGAVRCLAGKLACPPEDCGGLGGYEELAAWVRSGHDDALLPDVFDSAAAAHAWLPDSWDPQRFDIDEVNTALAAALAQPVEVSGELAAIVDKLEARGVRQLRQVLGRPGSHGSVDVTPVEAERLTKPYRVLLDVVGDGLTLTAAGYLPPVAVREIAARTGITTWWIGTANREDQTFPVAKIRDSARALGLVSVRKGRLNPTAAARKVRDDPYALWKHIVDRLPVGTKDYERDSGWLLLAVAGSDAPAEQWDSEIVDLMMALGWRDGSDGYSPPSPHGPTYEVIDLLAGYSRHGRRVCEAEPAVGATARAVIRHG